MSDILKSNTILRLCKISYQFTRNVNSIINDADRFHKKVILNTNQSWFEIQCQKAKLEYSEPAEENPNGTIYKRKLSVIFPSEKDADIELFENLSNSLLIIKLDYSNGSSKLFGDLLQPVICLVGYISGQDTEFTPLFLSPSEKRSPWLTETTNI